MPMSEESRWVVGTGLALLLVLGGGVTYLRSTQGDMEDRLTTALTATEDRLTQRIDQADKRLTKDFGEVEKGLGEQIEKLDTALRTVEGETATLAGVETRLTQTIEASEARLSENLQNSEKRLTGRIDKIDDRLLKVEGESARLATLVKSEWAHGEVIWPLGAEKFAELFTGEVQSVADVDALKAMQQTDIGVKWLMMNPYGRGTFATAIAKAYRDTLQKHPEIAQAYVEALQKQFGLQDQPNVPPEDPSESE